MNPIVWTLVVCVMMYGLVTEACPSGCSCERSDPCNGTYVDCFDKGLTEVPTNIPSDTCGLWLDGNEISNIKTNAFNFLSNLQTLDLSGNQITTIQNNSFASLRNLRKL
ncbi:slit homolog 1 protein-like [Saccostrea cucullata]|uniref:slit homolog 1 protein-like n=1 Tax=Saccostrea cuccullata TaxID=36930 RepID=UPI002ED6A4ED